MESRCFKCIFHRVGVKILKEVIIPFRPVKTKISFSLPFGNNRRFLRFNFFYFAQQAMMWNFYSNQILNNFSIKHILVISAWL